MEDTANTWRVVNMHDSASWQWKSFSELSGDEVYELLQLRCSVFVVEQDCPYLDPDGLDQDAWHYLHREAGKLIACQRSLAPGVAYDNASAIGRIVVAAPARGRGLSREMVQRGIEFNARRWPDHGIEISAQAHLRKLYESLSFSVCSEPYLEDGIPHLHMRREAAA